MCRDIDNKAVHIRWPFSTGVAKAGTTVVLLVLIECELDSEKVSTLEGTNAIFVNNLNESSSSSLTT